MRSSIYGPSEVPPDDPAENYHEASKLYPETYLASGGPASNAFHEGFNPEERLGQPIRRRARAACPLPAPAYCEESVSRVMARRHSSVNLGGGSIELRDLSTLLHAGYGVRSEPAEVAPQAFDRVVPSGGGLYPLDLYCASVRVRELESGLFHFDPFSHGLEIVAPGDIAADLSKSSTMPELAEEAAVVFLITAAFWRNRAKYGLRAYRYTLLEAGHVGQNLLLQATALGLNCVPWGGFYDRYVDTLLGIDSVNESTIYMVSVGST
jgi:SagB-type dehydrogenase family enzyme